MSATESIVGALERNWQMVDNAIKDMDNATLARMPNGHSNSAAWILWHMSRVVDSFVFTRLRDKPQLWVTDGWAQKFTVLEGAEDRGLGWSAEQVKGWQPPARGVLLGYYEAMKAAALDYLRPLTAADLAVSKVIPPTPEPRTVGNAIGQMTWDNVAHGGQIAYLRGYFQGMGWHR